MSSSTKATAKRLPEVESCVLREETTKVCEQQKKMKSEDQNSTNRELTAAQLKNEDPKVKVEPENCTICFDEMKVTIKLPCGHLFCFSCAKVSSSFSTFEACLTFRT